MAAGNDYGSVVGTGVGGDVINGVTFIGRLLENTPARELKSMADEIKRLKKRLLFGRYGWGKASIVVAVTSDITDKRNAVDLVKIGSAALGGGGGGGRPDMAQAGGPNTKKVAEAIKAVSAAL